MGSPTFKIRNDRVPIAKTLTLADPTYSDRLRLKIRPDPIESPPNQPCEGCGPGPDPIQSNAISSPRIKV